MQTKPSGSFKGKGTFRRLKLGVMNEWHYTLPQAFSVRQNKETNKYFRIYSKIISRLNIDANTQIIHLVNMSISFQYSFLLVFFLVEGNWLTINF
jgi:hypothetical protein